MASSTNSMAVELDEAVVSQIHSPSSPTTQRDGCSPCSSKRKESITPALKNEIFNVAPRPEPYCWGQCQPQPCCDTASLCSRRHDWCDNAFGHMLSGREDILGEGKLPTGSVMTKHSRYGSRLEITSSGETAPGYEENTSPIIAATRENSHNFRRSTGHIQDESHGVQAVDKPCFLDRFVQHFVKKFLEFRNALGIFALLVGVKALVIMVVLLATLGVQGHRRCARTVFCVCSVVLALSCGLFTAATGRSLGEVVILMTFLLCLGILLSSQFDAMMGFKWDDGSATHSHG